MSLDQAYRLRQLARASGPRRADSPCALPMVVVSGGKGGVGTSTIAMRLATGAARLGKRVLLVEADLNHGGEARQACDGGSLADCIAGRLAVRDVLETGPDGIWVLPAAWAPRDLTECTATAQDRLIGELRTLHTHADVLMLDAGSSRNHFVRRFWQAASIVLMVTTPDAASVMETYAAIKVLLAGDTSIPVYTVVNFAVDESNAQVVHERVRGTCKRFLGLRTAPLGDVPVITDRAPIVGESAFNALAGSLCEELGLEAARPRTRLAA